MNVVLVAQFETIFKDFGIPLPRMTIAMIMLSHAFAIGLAGLRDPRRSRSPGPGSSGRLFLRPAARRSLASKIPVVGGVWRYTSWAEFCHLLALLLESRLAPARGAPADGRGHPEQRPRPRLPGHGRRRRAWQDPGRGDGGPTPSSPPACPGCLRWAQDQGAIAEILHMAGEMFEARARGQATFAGTVMAVLSVIVVLWGIFTVIFGLMLPMITLISRLSG